MSAATLTVDERRALLGLGYWPVADLLIDPERGSAALRQSMMGGSHIRGFPQGVGYQCEKRGIVLTRYDEDEKRVEIVLVRWVAAARYARDLSDTILADLRAARRAYSQTWMAYVAPRYSVRYPRPRLTPPQRTTRARLLTAHRAASDWLDRALAAALPLDDVEVVGQLELFPEAAA